MLFTAVQPAKVSAKEKLTAPKIRVRNVSKGIKITWSDSENARKYVVYRRLSSRKKFKAIKRINAEDSQVYIDATAKSGKSYNYKVEAVRGKKEAHSKVREIVRLKTPEIWNRTDASGCIYISAQGQVSGAEEYEVYSAKVKKKKTGEYKQVATIDATDPWAGYRDKETEKGVFNFKIRAVKGKSKSAFSPVVTVDYFKPLEISATLREDNNGIDVTWAKIDNVDGFRIYRSENGGEPELLKDIPLEECNIYLKTKKDNPEYFYTDRKAKDFVTYEYYVEVYRGKKVLSKEKAMEPVTYQSADYFVKIGEISSEAAQDIADAKALLEEMGMNVNYTVVLSSNAPYILEVDENNNLIGMSYGKAELKKTVTMIVDGKETVNMEYLKVRVLYK